MLMRTRDRFRYLGLDEFATLALTSPGIPHLSVLPAIAELWTLDLKAIKYIHAHPDRPLHTLFSHPQPYENPTRYGIELIWPLIGFDKTENKLIFKEMRELRLGQHVLPDVQ